MILTLLTALAYGQAAPPMADLDAGPDVGGMVPSGWRITPLGGGHGLSVAETAVVGGSGGTNVTTVSARVGFDAWTFGARLPVAAYRAPDGRETDVGNLMLEGFYLFSLPGPGGGEREWQHGIGFEGHVNPGSGAYTWLHRADELWPGAGLNLVYQARTPTEGGVAFLLRGSAGLHGARDYEPFPGLFAQLGAAAGADWSVPGAKGLGLVGETAITYWDLSPWEVTGLVRFDPVPGLRARGGVVLPMASWIGWSPSTLDKGLDEVTLHLDLGMAY